MGSLNVESSVLPNSLRELLEAQAIEPGDQAGYATCKTILAYHPLGLKMTRSPVVMAMSKPREIAVPDGPEEQCVKAFRDAWRALDVDNHIKNCMTLARAYGAAAVIMVIDGEDPQQPINLRALGQSDLTFNVLDPLNTAGSMVMNQNPNSSNFMRATVVHSNGVLYHKSRSCIMFHEQPIYLEYSTSAFGYVGRSVFQRALYPLKSYIQTMRTDDAITRKVGVIVAKMKAAGTIADNMVAWFLGKKRELLKEATTGNVINISNEDEIETLNMQNAEAPMQAARKNIIENIATACDMPAKILNQETFAEGFGEGTEDAKAVIRYLNSLRGDMEPLFEFFDRIVQYRAWTPEFFATIKRQFPTEYGTMTYDQAFYRWSNSFTASWPSLSEEPESKQIEVEKVKFETVMSLYTAMKEDLDPHSKSKLIEWVCDAVNSADTLFPSPLDLDAMAIEQHAAEQEQREQEQLAQQAALAGSGFGPQQEDEQPKPRPKLLSAV